jgi:hypothetical protein
MINYLRMKAEGQQFNNLILPVKLIIVCHFHQFALSASNMFTTTKRLHIIITW